MGDLLTTIVSTVVVLGIMILVHEWGHFVAARAFGVRVDIFSIGFGPRLWGRKSGDTDYRISALPLGGYVKMAGDNPSEERAGDPAEFLSKPRWQRAIIALAGPTMNILMALAILAALFALVGEPVPKYYDQPAEIAAVPQKSSAQRVGIKMGDHIVDVNGVRVATWGQALERVSALLAKDDLSVTLERDGVEYTVDVKSKIPFDLGDSLGYPRDSVFVGDISRTMPAYAAGVKEGDEIVAINGTPMVSWMQCVNAIRGSNGEELKIDLKRAEQTLQVNVKPVLGRSDLGGPAWQIGFRNRPIGTYHKMAPLPAMKEAYARTVDTSVLILNTVGMLVTGRVALREMSGVIGISHEAGQAAKRGPIDLILLMASISLNLGILNLLPIPILDGGHLLLLSVEGIRRRDLSLAVKERFVQVGMVFLLVVFAIVMYNDVLKLLPRR